VPQRLRRLAWPLAFALLALVMYVARVQHEMVDFEVYRTAAVRALDAEPLYRTDDGHYQFKYLPAFALAMAPFAWMGPEAAKVVWYALSVGLLWVFVSWSIRALPDRRRSTQALAWLSILLMAKFYAHELNLGQTNILLGVVLVASLIAAQRERPVLAGVLVGFGIFVKPYAVILLAWLPLAAGASGVVAAIAVLGAGLALPAVVYGWQGNLDLVLAWYRTVTDTTAPNLLVAENVSLATMWAKWIGVGTLAARLAVLTTLAALAGVAWAMRQRARVPSPLYLEFGVLMLLVPLISPQGWDYVLLVATPAIVCLVDRCGDVTLPWRITTVVALGFMSFTIFDLLGRALYSRLMEVNIVSVCALVLLVCLIHLRSRAVA
jgi:hypothetical protein